MCRSNLLMEMFIPVYHHILWGKIYTYSPYCTYCKDWRNEDDHDILEWLADDLDKLTKLRANT